MRSASSTAYLRWLPALCWMGLIFLGSTDVLSYNHTSRFIEPLLRWLTHDSLSAERIMQIHVLIRKGGHLCEYAVLGVLYWWALGCASTVRRAVLSILLAAFFASSDEFHQSFIPSRTASVHDVLIDTCGAIIGVTLLLTARRFLQTAAGNAPSPG